MMVFGLGNKIFQGLTSIPLVNYPIFVSLMSTFIYVPASFVYIWPMLRWGTAITAEQRAIPQRVWCVIGLLDAVSGIMQVFATTYIYNKALLPLLSQAAIPTSMVISRIILHTKYTRANYAGSFAVLVGLAIVLVPQMLQPSKDAGKATTLLLWCGVYVVSCIPMTLSSVFKERTLSIDVDPIYFNGWVAIYQLIFTVISSPLAALASSVPIKDLWQNTVDGIHCWFGHNSVASDQCSDAPFFFTAYLFFNLGFNVLIILILKYGSSNVLWLALTLMVPLSNIAFSLKFMPHAVPLRPTDIIGLCILMLGLAIYRFWDKIKPLLGLATDDVAERSSLLRESTPVHVSGLLPSADIPSFSSSASLVSLEPGIVRRRARARSFGAGKRGQGLPRYMADDPRSAPVLPKARRA